MRTAIALIVVLLVIALAAFWLKQTTTRDQLAKLKAQGMPVSISDLADVEQQPHASSASLKDELSGLLEADTLFSQAELNDPDSHGDLIDAYQHIAKQHPVLFKQLAELADAESLSPGLDYHQEPGEFMEQLMLRCKTLRSIARVLNSRCTVQLATGDFDEATRTALSILKISRKSDQLPTLISFLTLTAVQGIGLHALNDCIQTGQLSAQVQEEIENELVLQDTLRRFKSALITERAFGITMIEEQGLLALFQLGGYLTALQSQIDTAQELICEVDFADDKSTAAALVLPAIHQSRSAANRMLALVRALRIINEFNRSLINEPTLEDLNLPAPSKIDPFSGDQLIVKRSDDGWTVYSVGRDKHDDGGSLERDQDFGFGPGAR